MPADESLRDLSPKLEAVLQSLPDGGLALRLRRVYGVAARTLARLSSRSLLPYESVLTMQAVDSGLSAQLAPVIRETVEGVNALLAAIHEQFPSSRGGCAAQPLAAGGPLLAARRLRDAAELLHGWALQLGQGVARLCDAMRSPEVEADRWALLEQVQHHRERFREQIGCMLHESASTFGPVVPREVVPGYESMVRDLVLLRAIVSDLARVVLARVQRVREAPPGDMPREGRHLEWELESFRRTAAWRSLRAQDKRLLVAVSERLARLAYQESLGQVELLQVLEQLEVAVRGMGRIGQRQVLILHDREVWARCMESLRQAQEQLEQEPASAARLLAESATRAQALYGKSAELDEFLRRARKGRLALLVGTELSSTLRLFHGLLQRLEMV